MGWYAAHLHVDASFNKGLPLDHPYIRTFTKYQSEFGGANRVIVALMAQKGDIFTPEFFKLLKEATDEIFFLPGVDRAQVQSLFTPNVRYTEVVEDGFSGGNVIPSDFDPLREGSLARVRENIIKSGKIGQLVANDFTGAIVSAQLLEVDPTTGKKLDYLRVARELETLRTRIERESAGQVRVHIIGFAKVMGAVGDGARGVLLLFGISIIVTALLVWYYAGRWKISGAPVLCSFIAVIWQLGLLTALGYGIDPLSILVPFLIFAIGVSHGVQMMRAFRSAVFSGCDNSLDAAKSAFRQLLVPGRRRADRRHDRFPDHPGDQDPDHPRACDFREPRRLRDHRHESVPPARSSSRRCGCRPRMASGSPRGAPAPTGSGRGSPPR